MKYFGTNCNTYNAVTYTAMQYRTIECNEKPLNIVLYHTIHCNKNNIRYNFAWQHTVDLHKTNQWFSFRLITRGTQPEGGSQFVVVVTFAMFVVN